MASTSSVERSNAPPCTSVASLSGMPSSSTSVKLASPPRVSACEVPAQPAGAEQVDAGDAPHQLGGVVRLRALDAVAIEHLGRGGGRLGGARRDRDLFFEVGRRDRVGSRRGRLGEPGPREEQGADKLRPYAPTRVAAGAPQGLGSFFPK